MEDLIEKLIKAGYKATAPRLAVLEVLAKRDRPVSARDLYKRIKNVDQASVYRALNLFEELCLVNVESVAKEKLYCLAAVPHHHIICRHCGYMEEIKCDHDFGKFKNFSDVRHRLTLTGICRRCAK